MYLYNHIYQCLYSFIKKFLPCVSKIYICLYIYMYMYTLYKLILFDDKILKKGSCTCTLYLVVSVSSSFCINTSYMSCTCTCNFLLLCCFKIICTTLLQSPGVCVCVCVCISTFHRI